MNYANPALVPGKLFMLRLYGGLSEPKFRIPGGDIAGQDKAVGRNVTQFQQDDMVFGDISRCGFGAFAEYVSIP